MTARLAWIKAETDNPLVAASDGCTGLDLVTWSIRKYPNTPAFTHQVQIPVD